MVPVGPWARRVVTALLFTLSAYAIWRTLDLSWGSADDRDGTRWKVGPTVVVHVLEPHQTVSPTATCAIDQQSVEIPPCDLGFRGDRAMQMLQGASHALYLGVLLSLLAALLVLLPTRLGWWSWAPGTAAILAIWYAAWAMATQPSHALAVLGGLPFGIGGNPASMLVGLVLLLLPIGVITRRAPMDAIRGAIEVGLFAILVGLILLGFLRLDWELVYGLEPPIAAGAYLAYLHRMGGGAGSKPSVT